MYWPARSPHDVSPRFLQKPNCNRIIHSIALAVRLVYDIFQCPKVVVRHQVMGEGFVRNGFAVFQQIDNLIFSQGTTLDRRGVVGNGLVGVLTEIHPPLG